MRGFQIDSFKAAQTFVAIKARRGLDSFLENRVGEKSLRACIKNNVWITDYIPADEKYRWKLQSVSYMDIVSQYTDAEIYELVIPQQWKLVIESETLGKQWAMGQLQVIREYLHS